MRNVLPIAVQGRRDAGAWAIAQVETASTPALVARGDGTVIRANAQARPLMEQGALVDPLRTLVIDRRAGANAQVVRLVLQSATSPARRFDLTLIPTPCANVLMLGCETTLEANLVSALTSSRELFRDLALCSTDFAFETDIHGVFTWVSPGGALGFSAAELHGASPRQVLAVEEGFESFSARQSIEAREVWGRAKSGEPACIVLTVVPVLDARGQWRGARGVVRDVTALRHHQREANRLKRREDLIAAIVGAMRGQIEPRRMMLAAADALVAATASDRVTIRTVGGELSASVGEAVAGEACELTVATSYQGKTNGTVFLTRGAGSKAYGEEERSLLDAVVPHLGIAIALAQTLETVAAQSRTDALTGLLNRRGFSSEAQKRLGALAGAGRSGALLMIECDNFKTVNDTLGHAAGDALLSAIGRLLSKGERAGEIAARLGGDEFALLIEDANREGAVARAEAIRHGFADLRAELRIHIDITTSIGIALIEAGRDEDLDRLVTRADSALYTAKRDGRDRVAVAEPSTKVTACSGD